MKFNKHLAKIKPYKLSFSRAKMHKNGILKLDWNEATVPPSKTVVQSMINFLSKDNNLNWYPDISSRSLLKELEKYTKLPQEQILVTNGSDQAHELICNAFLNEEDRVFVPIPTYTHFLIWPKINGANLEFYKMKIKEKTDYEEFIKRINPGISLIYIVNPYIKEIPEDVIIRILKKNIPTVIDEAYFEFCGKSFVDLIKKYENLIITRSFSKALSFAGMRLGYICSSKKIIMELKKIHNFKSVNILAQIGGTKILQEKNYFKNYVKEVLNSMKILKESLRNSNFEIITTPSGFVLMKHKKINSSKLINKLEKEKIFARNMTLKGINNYVRLNLGTTKQTEDLMKRLKNIV